ncbi:MAG: serine/threonine-protein kinase, partial [Planctomycetota bacterium]
PAEELPEDSIAGPASETRYGILGEIARGGMGAIVKLVDNDIRRPVAMKVILGGPANSVEGAETARIERFVEEAQVTGQLEHPNIVPVHELGLDAEGKVYFTMKLVRGESLDAIIDAVADKDPEAIRKYSLSHLLQVFLKVCDAMAFAHSKGVVHRDLKPENVMVGRFGEVLVMDWGLAKVKGHEDRAEEEWVETIRSEKEAGRTLSGEVMGTPSYMPPEQAAGKVERVDERSDVFALGAVLYKILTHEAPYTGISVEEVARGALYGILGGGGAPKGHAVCVQGASGEESVEPDPEGAAIDLFEGDGGTKGGALPLGGGGGGGRAGLSGSPPREGAPVGLGDAASPFHATASGGKSGGGRGVDPSFAWERADGRAAATRGGGAGEGEREGGRGGCGAGPGGGSGGARAAGGGGPGEGGSARFRRGRCA